MSVLDTIKHMDIYLLDQILRGRIVPGMSIFDAGCGFGRNLEYFIREGYPVYGADANPEAIASLQNFTKELNPEFPIENFRAENLGEMSFDDHISDVVISCAVLHFSENDQEFENALNGSWRVLKPGGTFFCRLCSSIGIESLIQQIAGRRYHLPDCSDRYLVDEEYLMQLTRQLGGTLLDPIKTTVVQNQRSMTTIVLRKN